MKKGGNFFFFSVSFSVSHRPVPVCGLGTDGLRHQFQLKKNKVGNL